MTDIILDDTIVGGEGDDTITGTVGADFISSGAGDDFVVGDKDLDNIRGGDGDDIIVGGQFGTAGSNLDDVVPLTEDTGSDILYLVRPNPADLAELLSGDAGADVIVGGNWRDLDGNGAVSQDELGLGSSELEYQPGFANKIWGGAGDDTAYGANGFDTIGGGSGDDVIYGFGGADVLYGGAGNDVIFGGDGGPEYFHSLEGNGNTITETLYGGAGNDTLWGEGDEDILYGGADNDHLYGGDANDTLYGGSGNDWLDGGTGNDLVTTGAGSDTIVANFNFDRDRVSDFDVDHDRIAIEDPAFAALFMAGLQSAIEVTIGDEDGLRIDTGAGYLFLAGLDAGDIGNIEVVVLGGE